MYLNPQIRIGDVFGSLRVISEPFRIMKSQLRTVVVCECACGKQPIVVLYRLVRGKIRSCGCRRLSNIGDAKRTHGESYSCKRTPEYHNWDGIIQRCFNPKNKGFKNYGGRGITVDPRWRIYENFIADVGRCPGPGYSLDRKNNDGNYEPGNVHWATREEQARNRRDNHRLTYSGKTLCLTDWAALVGIKVGTLWRRLKVGWTVERALTVSVVDSRKNHRRR